MDCLLLEYWRSCPEKFCLDKQGVSNLEKKKLCHYGHLLKITSRKCLKQRANWWRTQLFSIDWLTSLRFYLLLHLFGFSLELAKKICPQKVQKCRKEPVFHYATCDNQRNGRNLSSWVPSSATRPWSMTTILSAPGDELGRSLNVYLSWGDGNHYLHQTMYQHTKDTYHHKRFHDGSAKKSSGLLRLRHSAEKLEHVLAKMFFHWSWECTLHIVYIYIYI